MSNPARTNWPLLATATFGGMAAAMQVGKAAAALPLIRAEMGLSVGTLSIYISLLSVFAASVGLGLGAATRKGWVRLLS